MEVGSNVLSPISLRPASVILMVALVVDCVSVCGMVFERLMVGVERVEEQRTEPSYSW